MFLETEREIEGQTVSEEQTVSEDQDRDGADTPTEIERIYKTFANHIPKQEKQKPSKSLTMALSYDNLKHSLDHKLRSPLHSTSHIWTKVDNRMLNDSKQKVSSIFQEHSQWLDNMKMQVSMFCLVLAN